MPVIQTGTFRTSTPNGVFRGVYIRIYKLVLGFGSNFLCNSLPPEDPKEKIGEMGYGKCKDCIRTEEECNTERDSEICFLNKNPIVRGE